MFGALPGLADRSFIIGYLVPAIVLALVSGYLFSDLNSVQLMSAAANAADGKLDDIVVAAAFVWFTGLGLMILNRPITQMLEGYYGPFVLGGPRAAAKWRALTAERQALGDEWSNSAEGAFPEEKRLRYEVLGALLSSQFPVEERLVLPTRFGNAMRAFEGYSRLIYGADSIMLWPHLLSVVPDAMRSSIDDAQSQVSCATNLTLVGFIIIGICLIRFSISIPTHAEVIYPTVIGVAILATWFCYEMAIERALAMGGVVKAAFDCYLPALSKIMGFQPTGKLEDERAFWEAVSRRLVYRRPLEPELWERVMRPRP